MASGRSTPDNYEEFVILMGTQYPMLTYRGDVTTSEDAQPGTLCGCDEVGRPYEVIEAVYLPGITQVYLQYAATENLNRQVDRLRKILQ